MDLLRVYDYLHNPINNKISHTVLDKFLEYEKNGSLTQSNDMAFIIDRKEVNDRLDCYSHMPSYKNLLKELHNLEKNNKVKLIKGKEFNIIKPISKTIYDSLKTTSFKYIDIGNTEKDLGVIKGYEEDLLINLPTRARMLIKRNDILIPSPVHSASGIILVPKEYDGQLCSNGFIVIRPTNHDEAILLFTILRSNFFQKQFFHLQSGINQQAITEDNFKEFILIPIPKKDSDKEKMIKSIKEIITDATTLKSDYMKKLNQIQNEFMNTIK